MIAALCRWVAKGHCKDFLSLIGSFHHRAAASILHPLGYTGDPGLGQVRVRGGALLLANIIIFIIILIIFILIFILNIIFIIILRFV